MTDTNAGTAVDREAIRAAAEAVIDSLCEGSLPCRMEALHFYLETTEDELDAKDARLTQYEKALGELLPFAQDAYEQAGVGETYGEVAHLDMFSDALAKARALLQDTEEKAR